MAQDEENGGWDSEADRYVNEAAIEDDDFYTMDLDQNGLVDRYALYSSLLAYIHMALWYRATQHHAYKALTASTAEVGLRLGLRPRPRIRSKLGVVDADCNACHMFQGLDPRYEWEQGGSHTRGGRRRHIIARSAYCEVPNSFMHSTHTAEMPQTSCRGAPLCSAALWSSTSPCNHEYYALLCDAALCCMQCPVLC